MVLHGGVGRERVRVPLPGILALGCLLACAAGGHATGQPPSIVVILVDDLGWGDGSCFGDTGARTPAIDRLATEGICFMQCYVNSPICSSSRVALSTGPYPQRWRIGSYLDARAVNAQRGIAQWLDPTAPMLARWLGRAGYRTGHFGKWHMGGQRDVDDAPPITAYGFDASLTNFEGMGPKLLPLTLAFGGKRGRIWGDAEQLGGGATMCMGLTGCPWNASAVTAGRCSTRCSRRWTGSSAACSRG